MEKIVTKKEYNEIEESCKWYLIEKYQGEDITYFNDEILDEIDGKFYFVEAGLSVYEERPFIDGNSMSWIEEGYKDMTLEDVEIFKIEEITEDGTIEIKTK